MKKLISSILLALGVLTMANAVEYNAPSSDFVLIMGGSFTMGSPENEDWRSNDETQHRVTVASFYMSKYEVTQKHYSEVTGKNPSSFNGDKLPVESITWLEAVEFCNALSKRDGRTPVYTISGSGTIDANDLALVELYLQQALGFLGRHMLKVSLLWQTLRSV